MQKKERAIYRYVASINCCVFGFVFLLLQQETGERRREGDTQGRREETSVPELWSRQSRPKSTCGQRNVPRGLSKEEGIWRT